MQAINKITQILFVLFHACFAGVLLGQLFSLYNYRETVSWVIYIPAGIITGCFLLILVFKSKIRRYIFRHFSFLWIHFSAVVLYAVNLFLFFLPVAFNFDESRLIYSSVLLTGIAAFLSVTAMSLIVNLGVLQEIYADLLQFRKLNKSFSQIIWLLLMGGFALLSIYMYRKGGSNNLNAILNVTLFIGTVVLILLSGVKFLVFLVLSSLHRYINTEALETGEEKVPQEEESGYYSLEENPGKVILGSRAEDRPVIYSRIRQIPLVDKTEELERIKNEFLPDDPGLGYTLNCLRQMKSRLNSSGEQQDTDSITDVMEIKAYIRTVIAEGNPMLVQKLLNDNRPEVKKAAIFATVYFKEPGLIPALVNFLKDPEYAWPAKEALTKLGSQCLPYLRSAKYRNKENAFFMEHCLELTESYKSSEAMDFLTEMLNEPQKRFRYKAALALLRNGYPLSPVHKTHILQFTESLTGTIAVQREILGKLKNKNDLLAQALREEIQERTALVISFLGAFLPMPVFGMVKSLIKGKAGGNPFSLYALIDMYFPLVHRAKYKILLGSDPDKNIAPGLQEEFLNEQICFNYKGQTAAIKHILKMDYSQIGLWLRVCALKKLSELPSGEIPMHVLAEIFNKNILLQEVAAEVLYDLNFDYYFLYMQRLHPERARILKHKIETHKILKEKGKETDSILLYHQILFLKTVPLFREHSYEELARNIELFSIFSLSGEKRELSFDPYKHSGYWIVNQGEFTISYRGDLVVHARSSDLIDMSFLAEAERNTVSLCPLIPKGPVQGLKEKNDKNTESSSLPEEKIHLGPDLNISFVEFHTLNKLYLRSGHSKNLVVKPNLNQAAKLHLA